MVTAEPYFAVSQPSDLIVMENVVRADTWARSRRSTPSTNCCSAASIAPLESAGAEDSIRRLPVELYEARNAVADRRVDGRRPLCDRDLPESREEPGRRPRPTRPAMPAAKPVTMTAREAVQTAEDARAIAVKRQEEERPGRGAPTVGGARSARGERAGSRPVRDGSCEARSRSGQLKAQADAER